MRCLVVLMTIALAQGFESQSEGGVVDVGQQDSENVVVVGDENVQLPTTLQPTETTSPLSLDQDFIDTVTADSSTEIAPDQTEQAELEPFEMDHELPFEMEEWDQKIPADSKPSANDDFTDSKPSAIDDITDSKPSANDDITDSKPSAKTVSITASQKPKPTYSVPNSPSTPPRFPTAAPLPPNDNNNGLRKLNERCMKVTIFPSMRCGRGLQCDKPLVMGHCKALQNQFCNITSDCVPWGSLVCVDNKCLGPVRAPDFRKPTPKPQKLGHYRKNSKGDLPELPGLPAEFQGRLGQSSSSLKAARRANLGFQCDKALLPGPCLGLHKGKCSTSSDCTTTQVCSNNQCEDSSYNNNNHGSGGHYSFDGTDGFDD